MNVTSCICGRTNAQTKSLRKPLQQDGRGPQKKEKQRWPRGQILIDLDRKELEGKVLQRKPKRSVPLGVFKKLNRMGTPDECISKKTAIRRSGCAHVPFMLFFGLPNMTEIRLFGETVVKRQNQLINGALLINLKFAK